MLQTVENAGEVLELFTVSEPEWGVTAAAERLGFSKSRTHALLSTLSEIGLLRRTAQSRYRLGWRVLALSRTLAETTEFRTEARKIMEELVEQTAELVNLATLEQGRVVYLERLSGTRAVRIDISHVGAELPAHCSGLGKVMLAYRPWREVEEIAARHGLPRLTEHTITDLERLHEEIKVVRRRGYAWDREEIVPEVACVAAPVFEHTGLVVAAISISAPAYRLRAMKEAYRGAICEAARRVSARLGYVPR